MSENEPQKHRAEEYVKMCFEIFKHLTTLSTAAALVVLAVYREISIERWLVTLTLVLFGATVLVCMMAMFLAAGYFADTPNPPTERMLGWLLAIVSFTFMLAVVLFTFLPIELPQWVALLISIGAAVILGFALRRGVALSAQATSAAQRLASTTHDREPEKDE